MTLLEDTAHSLTFWDFPKFGQKPLHDILIFLLLLDSNLPLHDYRQYVTLNSHVPAIFMLHCTIKMHGLSLKI